MFPGMPVSMGEGTSGLSYSGVFVRTDRERVLAELAALRFSGYVGPQEEDWVVAIAGNPLAKVAGGKRRIDDVARDLASTLEVVTLAAEVDRDTRLRLWTFDGDDALPVFDSAPPEADGGGFALDDFGNPVMSDGAFVDVDMIAASMLATFAVDDPDDRLSDTLGEDLGEDTSESERLVAVLRILGLPTWIVSSDSLPRRVPGGPDRSEVTRLGAGRQGVSGVLADAIRRPVRPRPKRDV